MPSRGMRSRHSSMTSSSAVRHRMMPRQSCDAMCHIGSAAQWPPAARCACARVRRMSRRVTPLAPATRAIDLLSRRVTARVERRRRCARALVPTGDRSIDRSIVSSDREHPRRHAATVTLPRRCPRAGPGSFAEAASGTAGDMSAIGYAPPSANDLAGACAFFWGGRAGGEGGGARSPREGTFPRCCAL